MSKKETNLTSLHPKALQNIQHPFIIGYRTF